MDSKKSYTGCWTCRSRKVKCTLERPECLRCVKSRVKCEGYDIKLRWSLPLQFDSGGISQPSQVSDDDHVRRRAVGFVRYEPEQTYKTYDEMDRDINALQTYNGEDSTLLNGHFGVFKGSETKEPSPKRQKRKSRTPPAVLPLVAAPPFSPLPTANNGNEWLSTELIGDALLTASALNGDTYFLDLFNNDDPLDEKHTLPQQFNSTQVDPQYPEFLPDEVLQLLFHKKDSVSEPAPLPPHSRRRTRTNEIYPILMDADDKTTMPAQIMSVLDTEPIPPSLAIDKFGLPVTSLAVNPMARYLMNYYIDQVADMMTVIPLAKNPWKFIYFPRAIRAIGELGALGKTSNAKNCLLNALLAVSAFNLQSKFTRNSDQMKHYLNLGIQLRQQATQFLKMCLDEDILTQKYKDVLVAVLSMVTIDVVWGTMSDCKVHLDICEKVIEKKMKVKKKLSSQATILHRIFSSMKLIQDSTSLEGIQESEIFLNEQNYKEFINVSSPNAAISPNEHESNVSSTRGVFHEKINDQGKIKIEFIVNEPEQKEQSVPSFIDITRTSFQPAKNKVDDDVISSDAIYGLPNSLILLFSEVVYLYRFRVYHDQANKPLPSFFEKLAQELERKILGWKLEWKLHDGDAAAGDSIDDKFVSPRFKGIYHHVMSFYHGLVIYFYRGILNTNALFLQERVENVLNHLNEIQNIVENSSTFIIPLFWQGFVAGSEAMTVFLQKGFNLWGQNISKTGIGSYWVARQIMLEVWRRKNSNAKNHTWADVIHDWGTNVMLS